MVHIRTVGRKNYSFIVSGKLWRSSMIMQDRETKSLWSHLTGEALDGPEKGKRLVPLPSVQTTWAEWVKRHPDTKLLRKEREIKSTRYERYFKDPDRLGIGVFRSRELLADLPAKSLVHGIARGPYAIAIADEKLRPGQLLNLKLKDDPLVVIRTADGGVRAFIARVGEKTLRFERDTSTAVVRDKQTGSTWDLENGVCVTGQLKAARLDEEIVRTAFWFSWISFYPHTAIEKE